MHSVDDATQLTVICVHWQVNIWMRQRPLWQNQGISTENDGRLQLERECSFIIILRESV